MAYELFFINKEHLETGEAKNILSAKGIEGDDFFISKAFMLEIKSTLRDKGLHFQSEDQGNEMEFNFPTFQIALFSNQIVLSIPHWKGNHSDEVSDTIEEICDILNDFGMSIYDPQSASVESNDFDVAESFGQSRSSTTSPISGKLVFTLILISAIIWFAIKLLY